MSFHSYSLYTWSPRCRNIVVLFVSGFAMIVCFLWLDALPVRRQFSRQFNSNNNNKNATIKKVFNFYSNGNNTEWGLGDDDNAPTGDDDSYHAKFEGIRGSKAEPEEQQQNKLARNYSDDDGIDSHSNSNEEDDTVQETNNDVHHQQPQKPKKNLPVLKSGDSATAMASIISPMETSSDVQSGSSPSRPELAWLMSYPNSGTSYTMTMVGKLSGKATASNYGRELTSAPEPNVPLYPDQWEGPFYNANDKTRPLPDDYIMVKTHCGGRCVLCGPAEYLVNETFFLDECRRGSGLFPKDQKPAVRGKILEGGFETVHYDVTHVKKAIHLIRNPFHNIVSRFHLERKHWVEGEKKHEVDRYTNDAKGFHFWCKDLNEQFGPTFLSSPAAASNKEAQVSIPRDVVELMQDVPCHGEMYKYVQWHNHANTVMTNHLKKPTMIVHYENYEHAWNKTVGNILNFLHLEKKGEPSKFSARHDYDPYFSPEQRLAAQKLIVRLARPAIYNQLERYFPKKQKYLR